MIDQKEIDTPMGRGTVLGLSPDRAEILVMYTRPKEFQDKTHGSTYIKWWTWNDETQQITGEMLK